MNLDRVLKYVWLSAGIILLLFLLSGIGMLINEWAFSGASYEQAGVVVDNKKKEVREKVKLALSYENVTVIGSSDFYMLPVNIAYEESQELDRGSLGSSYSSDYSNVNQPSNLIFLDKEFNVIRSLLNKKALITDFRYPQNSVNAYVDQSIETEEMKFIIYQIAFADSDKDGQIDVDDQADLYISALDGGNLTQLTKGWKVVQFSFYDNYQTILISYTEPGDKAAQPRKYFATYSIASKELKKLTGVDDELKNIEKILAQ